MGPGNWLGLLAALVLVLLGSPLRAQEIDLANARCQSCRQAASRYVLVERSGPSDGLYCSTCAAQNLSCGKCGVPFVRTAAPEAFTLGNGQQVLVARGMIDQEPGQDPVLCRTCAREDKRAQTQTPPVTTVEPQATPEPVAARPRRNAGALVAGVVLVALLVAAGIVWLVTRPPGDEPVRPSRGPVGLVMPPAAAVSKARVDPTLGDGVARALRSELAAGSWDGTAKLFAGLRDWDDRHFYATVLSDWPGRPAWLEQWVKRQPDNPAALLVRGRHSIHWAWEARGGGKGANVSDDGARLFLDRLKFAETDLAKAASLDPQDPTPLAFRLLTALGLSLPADEKQSRFDAAVARDALNLGAHEARLSTLTKKWGGSHEAMFAFAREAVAKAPEGSPLALVLVQAHVERWLWGDSFEEPRDEGADRYFLDPVTQAEIKAAHARSLGSLAWKELKRAPVVRNYFLYAFSRMGAQDLARVEAEKLGDRWIEIPWGLAGGRTVAEREFRKACEAAGVRKGKGPPPRA